MSIWQYDDQAQDVSERLLTSVVCAFCRTNLKTLRRTHEEARNIPENTKTDWNENVRFCPCCGWWVYDLARRMSNLYSDDRTRYSYDRWGSYAALRNFDLTDENAPLDEVRRHLTAKFESRFSINPRLLEKTVGSIYASCGYESWVTAYHNDLGVDVILKKGDLTIGVQVKATKRKIEAEHIRAFSGALRIRDLTMGIYVVTSDYRSGAYTMCSMLDQRGQAIELVNAERLYDVLKISSRPQYKSYEDWMATVGRFDPISYEKRAEYSGEIFE